MKITYCFSMKFSYIQVVVHEMKLTIVLGHELVTQAMFHH